MSATEAKVVTVGEETIRLEPFSGRKAIRVIRTIEHITKGVPEILDRWADFTREYEARNVTEVDRATARHFYGPRPIYESEPVLADDGKTVVTDAYGEPLVRRVPRMDSNNQVVLGADPLAHMTDADWEASGNRLRLPKSPNQGEQIAAVFPMALDLAEEEVLKLLAVLATPNAELKRKSRDGSLKEYLAARADELIDAPATDLLELAVVAGEMVDEQFTTKVRELGGRLPNALRLLGLSKSQDKTSSETTSKSESSETKPTPSTASPSPTDGDRAEPSIEPTGVSS